MFSNAELIFNDVELKFRNVKLMFNDVKHNFSLGKDTNLSNRMQDFS